MPPTPSQTPPRAASAGVGPSPSRLAIAPILRPSPSLSSLHIHSHNTATSTSAASPPPLPQPQVLDSSASSVMNFDPNEGILVQDTDTETVDVEEINVVAQTESTAASEESKKILRDQLRRTLSHKQEGSDITVSRHQQKAKQEDTLETTLNAASKYPPREYFVLTDAGKPVFISRPGSEDSDDMTSAMGIMQAIISVFLDDNDKLRCINAGSTRITFLIRSPLYYVCASSWGEPESVTRSHLEYLHLQILSIVTAAQLRRLFERRTNFDLRRLLNGAENFLTSLLDRLEFDMAMSTSSLHCLKLDPSIRKQVADALVPTHKMKDILYVILVARGRVVTLLRPRKHSIHPADIHILLNTIHSPSILRSSAPASWIPICLPKFNPAGFVNAYISFLRKDDGQHAKPSPPIDEPADETVTPKTVTYTPRFADPIDSGLALACISGSGEFENTRTWCDSVAQRLEGEGTLEAIEQACRMGQCDYSVSALGIPGLRHFIYKSRAQVQITSPSFEDPYDSMQERRRLVTLYQLVHDAIHAKSGQEGTLKLQYLRTEKESVMGWITQPFELCIALSPRLPKAAAVGAANAVARWVKKEESRLFLRDAPVF